MLLGSGAACAQTDYLPLESGNRWMYRSVAGSFTLSVGDPRTEGGQEYFPVTGFPSQPQVLIRRDEKSRLMLWDPESKTERTWLDLTAAEGVEASTGIDTCNQASIVTSAKAGYKGPVGEFDSAVAVRYTVNGCADAGVDSDVWLPAVGLLRRSYQTFAGPRAYDLVYARLGGRTVISEPELAFRVSLDRAIYISDQMPPVTEEKAVPLMLVRMTMRNTTQDKLTLSFPSGQVYDLVIRNADGKQVYQWSADKSFAAVLHDETVRGESNWAISVPLGTRSPWFLEAQPWPDGKYTAEAWLTAGGGKLYGGTVAFEILSVH